MTITEEHSLDIRSAACEERLNGLSRYAQVGQCVNSVAHDVNNYLGAILAYAELVQLDDKLGPDSARMLGEIISAVQRCNALVSSLTGIARKERDESTLIGFDQVVESVLLLRQYDIKVGHIQLESNIDSHLGYVLIDRQKVEQAIVYLLSNAIEAVEPIDNRRILVRATSDEDGVEMRIWDSASPIRRDIQERMFTPFVTTKNGHHLGLGLPMACAIAKMHGGALTYDEGDGFCIRLARDSSNPA